jgi:hypothetical protein
LGVLILQCTSSSFRPAPRRGHLDRIKRLYGYVAKMKEAAIRYRTEMPDVLDLKFVEEDWSQSPYAGSKEDIPKDMPRALGKPVLLLTYGDANLCHDLLSGKAVTGLLHFINKTPFDWYSKKQNTVETATYGAESGCWKDCHRADASEQAHLTLPGCSD